MYKFNIKIIFSYCFFIFYLVHKKILQLKIIIIKPNKMKFVERKNIKKS